MTAIFSISSRTGLFLSALAFLIPVTSTASLAKPGHTIIYSALHKPATTRATKARGCGEPRHINKTSDLSYVCKGAGPVEDRKAKRMPDPKVIPGKPIILAHQTATTRLRVVRK